MEIKKLLKEKAYQNIPLSFEEAYDLAAYTIEGCLGNDLAQIQSVAALCALHNKATYRHKNAYLQIAGISAGIIDFDIKKSASKFVKPNVPYVVDNCGMGGDHFVTANVSTLAGLTASSLGVYMCKHGSPANADQGRHGSSDFIKICGIPSILPKSVIEKMIESHRFGYVEALDTEFKLIHQQTHNFAKLPHMNDLIGPLTHPVDPQLLKYKIIGINHLVPLNAVIKALQLLNEKGYTFFKNAIALRGSVGMTIRDGIDELSITKWGTAISELSEDGIKSYRIDSSDFGIKPVNKSFLAPPKDMNKADFSLSILNNEAQPESIYMIAASSALILKMVGEVKSLKEGFQVSYEQIRSGRVASYLTELRNSISEYHPSLFKEGPHLSARGRILKYNMLTELAESK